MTNIVMKAIFLQNSKNICPPGVLAVLLALSHPGQQFYGTLRVTGEKALIMFSAYRRQASLFLCFI